MQFAQTFLSRKFRLCPGMTQATTLISSYLDLLKGVARLAKSKFNLAKTQDQLQLAAFLSTTMLFLSKELVAFPVEKKTVLWITHRDLEELKAFVNPLLIDNTKRWNPFLAPFRMLFERPAEMETALVSSSNQPSPIRSAAKRSRKAS